MKKIFNRNKKVFLIVQLGILLFPLSNNYGLLIFGTKAPVYIDYFVDEDPLSSSFGIYTEFLVFKNKNNETVLVKKPEHISIYKDEQASLLYSPFDQQNVLVLSVSGFVSPFNGVIMLICSIFWFVFCLIMDVSIMYEWFLKRSLK